MKRDTLIWTVCLGLVPTGAVPPAVLGLGLGVALAFMVTPTMSMPEPPLPHHWKFDSITKNSSEMSVSDPPRVSQIR